MHKLNEQNPPWKVFCVVFHKVQFSAQNCLNIYLNDISNVLGILEFTLFADDTNIIYYSLPSFKLTL